MELRISEQVRDWALNILGHTPGLMIAEGGRVRPVLPLESARLLLALQQAEPVQGEGSAPEGGRQDG